MAPFEEPGTTTRPAPKIIIIGDVHGQATKLKQVISKINLNRQTALLFVGDYLDPRGNAKLDEVYETIELLISLRGRVGTIYYGEGNHDRWLYEFLMGTMEPDEFASWMENGGKMTFWSYMKEKPDLRSPGKLRNAIPTSHKHFFMKNVYGNIVGRTTAYTFPLKAPFTQKKTHITIAHAGINPNCLLKDTSESTYLWDRNLVIRELRKPRKRDLWDHGILVVGHTPTQYINGTSEPIIGERVIALDTGAGFGGPLTALEIPSLHWYQSD